MSQQKIGKSTDKTSLGDRMKNYEREFENSIPSSLHIVGRLDGKGFSKFTKSLEKPFSNKFSKVMAYVSKELMREFPIVTVYTQSDEITFVLKQTDFTHIYNGRIQKITSIFAAYASVKFNEKFKELFPEEVEKHFSAVFDCRIYGVDSDSEVINSFLWRLRDAERNSNQSFCYYSLEGRSDRKEIMFKKPTNELIDICKKETGLDWNKIKNKYKYGMFFKKFVYLKDVDVERTKIKRFKLKNTDYNSLSEFILVDRI
jgi:tRNA(His) 5'-end guanylyltransferase